MALHFSSDEELKRRANIINSFDKKKLSYIPYCLINIHAVVYTVLLRKSEYLRMYKWRLVTTTWVSCTRNWAALRWLGSIKNLLGVSRTCSEYYTEKART